MHHMNPYEAKTGIVLKQRMVAEDACQVRKGTPPHALAVLNSFVLALFDGCGVANVKQYMRRVEAQPLLKSLVKK